MGVLCTNSFTAPFAVVGGEDIGSAIVIALANEGVNRTAPSKGSRRECNEGMRVGWDAHDLEGGESETGTKEQAVKRFKRMVPLEAPLPLVLDHVTSQFDLPIGCYVQPRTNIRGQSDHRRSHHFPDIYETSSELESLLLSIIKLSLHQERPARMSTSVLASLAPSTSALVNVGAAILLIAVALVGMTHRDTLTSCSCPLA